MLSWERNQQPAEKAIQLAVLERGAQDELFSSRLSALHALSCGPRLFTWFSIMLRKTALSQLFTGQITLTAG